MNISEANAVCRVIDALGRPSSAALTSTEVRDDLVFLAEKAHKALSAGPLEADVVAAWERFRDHQPVCEVCDG